MKNKFEIPEMIIIPFGEDINTDAVFDIMTTSKPGDYWIDSEEYNS